MRTIGVLVLVTNCLAYLAEERSATPEPAALRQSKRAEIDPRQAANELPYEPLQDQGSMLQQSLDEFFEELHFNTKLISHESQLLIAQTEVMRAQETQETLNRRLRSGQFTEAFLSDYTSQSTEQTNAVINSTSEAMKPYLPALQRSVANFLIASYLKSVTNGASLYAKYIGDHSGSVDMDSLALARNMTSSYDRLISMSRFASLDAAILESTTHHILSILHL